MSNDKVRRVFQEELNSVLAQLGAKRDPERHGWFIPQDSIRAGRPLGAPVFGSGAFPPGWIYEPAPPLILYDDPPRNWAPWIIALKIAAFLIGCTAWWIFCALV